MSKGYVPSGSGRDNFIFNDRDFKYGRYGVYRKIDAEVHDKIFTNQFWQRSNKKCEQIDKNNKRPAPTKFLSFETKKNFCLPHKEFKKPGEGGIEQEVKTEKKVEIKSKSQAPTNHIVGYSGHVNGAKYVYGKKHNKKKELETVTQLDLPSFKKMDLELLQKRLNQIRSDSQLDINVPQEKDEIEKILPNQHKKRMKITNDNEVKKLQYIPGYSGHKPIYRVNK